MAITRATTLSGLVGGGLTLSPSAASITAENITGFAATFKSNVTASSNLDVDGRSSLDDVNIAEGLNVTGGITTVAGQATIGNLTVGASCTITGALTYEDVTNIDSIGLITARNGLQVLAGITTLAGQSNLTNVNVSSALTATNTTLGFTTFSEAIDIESATETVAVAATSPALSPGGRVIVECDAASASVFTYACSNGEVGIVSFKNFPVSKNQINTYTILFTQNATGTGNTTNTVGIGTSVTLNPLGVSGFSTSARVASASTITLTNNANDIDVVTFAIHYNGGGTGTAGNYTVLATKNNGYRYGSIGF